MKQLCVVLVFLILSVLNKIKKMVLSLTEFILEVKKNMFI